MASISLEQVKKVYANDFEAIHGLDLEVREGEFMVLVGPSGCGKTTALRMVAGLEEVSAGTIRIGDEVVNDVPPKDRDIAMVFQNYALYPHMTVAENMGFALQMQRMDKREISARVNETARILGLTPWLDRKPGQLSGGQRQRVAMGRAITRAPAVFLMDEPLSNLDAKLRTKTRAEVLRIQRRLGVGTLYITHDQTEAMTMGDRVAVMRDGNLQQCDSPQKLFYEPMNLFVAAFIGSPAMNLFEAGLSADLRTLRLGSQDIAIPDGALASRPALERYADRPIVIGVRPEDLTPSRDGEALQLSFAAEVELVEPMGSEVLVHFQVDAPAVQGDGQRAGEEEGLTEAAFHVAGEGVARVDHSLQVRTGERLRLHVKPDRLYFFDPETGASVQTEKRPASSS